MTFGNVDFGIVAGIAGGTLDVGDVVYAGDVEADTESEDNVAEWFAANASSAANCPGAIGVVHAVVGGGTASAGAAIRVRLWGLAQDLTVAGSPAVGATVYLTDAGGLSTTAGTVTAAVGSVVDGAGPYAVWWSAVAGVSGGGGGAYSLPEYLVGPLGCGPGGSDPQFQDPQDAVDQAVADGATFDNPRAVRMLTGTYTGPLQLATGVVVYGVDRGDALTQTVRIEGNVSYLPDATEADIVWSELRNVCIVGRDADSTSALLVRASSGAAVVAMLHVENVWVDALYTSIAYAAVRVDDGNATGVLGALRGSIGVIVRGLGQALLADDGSSINVALLGLRVGEYSSTQAAAVRVEGGSSADLWLDPRCEAEYTIDGQCQVTGTGSTLRLRRGVSVQTRALATTNNVFDVASGGALTLEGEHRFSAGSNTNYLFGCSAGAGTVTVQGPYTLDAPATKSLYKVQSGITLSGATHALEDVVETITGTATVSRNTTLALIVPASGSTFTVTLPDPDGYSRGRGLTVKHAGTTNTQDITLARHSGGTIDGAASNRTLKHNDVLELMPDGAGEWQIRSSHLGTTPTGGGATYSVLTLHKAYTEAINAEIQCGGGVFRTAEHDNSGSAKFRCVLYTTDVTEGATVRLYLNGSAVELAVGDFFLETFSTSLTELTSSDLNALGGSNWPPSDGDLLTVSIDGSSTGSGGDTSVKAIYSAELLFEP